MKLFSFAARAALSAFVVAGLSATSDAGLLVKYDFDGGNTIASDLESTTLAGTFNPGGNGGGTLTANEFQFAESTASSEVEAPYATLSIAALAGNTLNLDRIVFDAAFFGNGGQGTLGVRFQGNGSNVEQQINLTAHPTYSEYSLSLAGISIMSDTLKLYVYDHDGGASARVRIDNVQIYGSASVGGNPSVPPVPEPSTLALVGLGAFGFGASRLRQRRKNRTAASAA